MVDNDTLGFVKMKSHIHHSLLLVFEKYPWSITYRSLEISVFSFQIIHLQSQSVIGVAVDGVKLGRRGQVSFLQVLRNYHITIFPYKGRRQNSLPLTTNFSQNVTEPSKGISYPVGDLCRCFTKLTGSCAYTLHSNPIPPTDCTNDLL